MPRLAYLIPEFPSQTHIWMWREIVHMREAGVDLGLFSTRRPTERDRARHAFAEGAIAETTYLWPPRPSELLRAFVMTLFTSPLGLARAVWLCLTLPLEVRFRQLRSLALLAPAMLLARRLKAQQITHLHCHTCANSAVIAMIVKRLSGIPFSMTLNANVEWWGGAMRQKFEDAAFTVAITQWLLDQLRRDFGTLSRDQAILGRIGVDTRKWKRAKPVPPDVSPFRLMTIGRLHSSKGHDILLRALASVRAAGTPVTLQIAGTGPDQTALERLVGELGLSTGVTFLGSLSEDQLIEKLQDVHLFVLASHAEPLGVVYMEAMSLELPVIGTAAGGVGEIITHGTDGLLVEPDNVAALARAITELFASPARRKALGFAARQTIIERFDSRIGAATLHGRLYGTGSSMSVPRPEPVLTAS